MKKYKSFLNVKDFLKKLKFSKRKVRTISNNKRTQKKIIIGNLFYSAFLLEISQKRAIPTFLWFIKYYEKIRKTTQERKKDIK